MESLPRDPDAEHLRLLSIFHYIVAGMMALWGSFPIIHFLMGGAMLVGSIASGDKEALPMAFAGGLFMLIGGVWMLIGWSLAGCLVFAGRSLAQRRRRTFCMVVACLAAALCMPFGTILGVFTLVVLSRPTVKAAFEAQAVEALA